MKLCREARPRLNLALVHLFAEGLHDLLTPTCLLLSSIAVPPGVCVCERERESESACVCVRVCMFVCVCVCVCVNVCWVSRGG